MPRIDALEMPSIGDIVQLDSQGIKSIRLDDLLELMRRCGISTEGIGTLGAAATRLVDRGRIEMT